MNTTPPERKKILLLDTNDAVGGIVHNHAMMLRALDRTRIAPHLACLANGPLPALLQDLPDLPVWHMNVGTKSARWCGGLVGKAVDAASVVPLVLSAVQLAIRCRRAGIQGIHTSDKKRSLLLTLLLHRLTRIPYLYHIHNNYIDYPANRRALARASLIIANSAEMRRDFIQNLGPGMERIRVLYNGIDTARFRPGLTSTFRQEAGAAPGDVLIGITSRLAPDKGQDDFLRAAALVAPTEPKARFVVVGDASVFSDNSDYLGMLKSLAKELDIEKRVSFVGFRADMVSVHSGLDVLVNAAWREAFGLVVVESMACAKTVVGTAAGGIPEIITHGQDGFLFPPRDPNKLADILRQILRNPGLRQTIGMAARRTVENRFSIQTMAKNVEQVYLELTEPRP